MDNTGFILRSVLPEARGVERAERTTLSIGLGVDEHRTREDAAAHLAFRLALAEFRCVKSSAAE